MFTISGSVKNIKLTLYLRKHDLWLVNREGSWMKWEDKDILACICGDDTAEAPRS